MIILDQHSHAESLESDKQDAVCNGILQRRPDYLLVDAVNSSEPDLVDLRGFGHAAEGSLGESLALNRIVSAA
jgi:hypothetical protein